MSWRPYGRRVPPSLFLPTQEQTLQEATSGTESKTFPLLFWHKAHLPRLAFSPTTAQTRGWQGIATFSFVASAPEPISLTGP